MNRALCRSCGSCGFPMQKPADHAGGDTGAPYCGTCGRPDGQLKPYAEVLQANAEYLVRLQGIDPQAAVAMAQALLATMPAWAEQTTPIKR
jgi:Putative zinc ribbon domain